MTTYEQAVTMQKSDIEFEVVHVASGQVGCAEVYPTRVLVFIGNDDGSDDKYISIEEFNEEYKVL